MKQQKTRLTVAVKSELLCMMNQWTMWFVHGSHFPLGEIPTQTHCFFFGFYWDFSGEVRNVIRFSLSPNLCKWISRSVVHLLHTLSILLMMASGEKLYGSRYLENSADVFQHNAWWAWNKMGSQNWRSIKFNCLHKLANCFPCDRNKYRTSGDWMLTTSAWSKFYNTILLFVPLSEWLGYWLDTIQPGHVSQQESSLAIRAWRCHKSHIQ